MLGRGRIRAELDQDVEALGALMDALTGSFGHEAFRTADAADGARTDDMLRTAFESLSAVDRKGQVTATTIGYCFRTVRDRIVDGRRLVKDRTDRHAKTGLWRVAASAVDGDAGDAGDALRPSGGPRTSPALPASPADHGKSRDVQRTTNGSS
jgi:hypothetical protein